MYDNIKRCLEKNNPDFVVFENVQFQKNYGTFQQLSQLQGLIMALLFERNIAFQYIEATAWRAFCGIKGRKRVEQKVNAIQMVKDKFNLSVSEDEADAILLGNFAVNKILK